MKDLIQPSTQNDGQLRVAQVQTAAEAWSPQHALTWAFETFGNRVAISSAFGVEGMVLIDMASRISRKLGGLSAWITSIRRDQTSVRSAARRVEWDAKFGLVKINPIVDWNSKQVWRYIHDHDVPYNALHDQDFPSIGCTHCTRAVRPGEDPRAGRWPGFNKTECGLHIIEPVAAPFQIAAASAECGD